MSYDVVFVGELTLDAAAIATWKKAPVVASQHNDWLGSFANAVEERTTVAKLLARWKKWGEEDEPEFLTCTLTKTKLVLRGLLAETTYHEVAPLLGAFWRSAESAGGKGELFATSDGFCYRITVGAGRSSIKALEKLPRDAAKATDAVVREAQKRIGEDPASSPAPKYKTATIDSTPPPSPDEIGGALSDLNEQRQFAKVQAYAARYFEAGGLAFIRPYGAQLLLDSWFRQQKAVGVMPLLDVVVARTTRAIEADKVDDPWLLQYGLINLALWVFGFAGQADRGIAWFGRYRAAGCFVSPTMLDGYVYLLYTSITASNAEREKAMADLLAALAKNPSVAGQMTWVWHNLAALAGVMGDADRVAEFVTAAKAARYDLNELRNEPLIAKFRADPRVKSVLG